MSSDRRALLTDTERAILNDNKDVSDNYYYTIVSRVRDKIQLMQDDMEALENHGKLDEELRQIVCEE